MRTRTLVLLGAGVFAVVLVATLPASLIAGRLPAGVVLDGVYGSVFAGGADSVTVNGAPLGELAWSFRPSALLALSLGYHVDLKGPADEAHGNLTLGAGGRLALDEFKLSAPVATLTQAAGQAASVAGAGRLRADIGSARLVRGWPEALSGTIQIEDLKPAMLSVPIGNYEVRFEPGAKAGTNAPLRGTVRDVKAPLAVSAQLTLQRDRTYVIEGTLTPRPTTPAEILPTLDALGPGDPSGKRAFSIGGTF